MGGAMDIDSRVGGGTTVTVTLAARAGYFVVSPRAMTSR